MNIFKNWYFWSFIIIYAIAAVYSESTKKEIPRVVQQDPVTVQLEQQYASIRKEAELLNTFKGKYPYDIKFLDQPIIKEHLIDISSTSTYELVKDYWNVESPIKIENDVLFATGCQAHNCASTNFAIAINLLSGTYYLGTYIDDQLQMHSDNQSPPQVFINWELERQPKYTPPTYQQTYYQPPAQTFGSYPCTQDCSGHQAGYDWAEKKDIDSIDNCGGNSQSFIEGCYEYVNENYPDPDSCENYNYEYEICED